MYIKIKVISKAHENSVKKGIDNIYIVRTTSVPKRGKANKMVQKLLADYLGVAKNNIKIIKGKTSKNKIIEVI